MPTSWRRCAGAILIIGSTSSTYGGTEAAPACTEPPPAGARQLIAGLALGSGQRLSYREEVHHPALAQPEVATGTMFVSEDGDLVREQATPARQISEVGTTMLRTRPAPGGEATLYPIPAEARPMLIALRSMLAGDADAVAAEFDVDLAGGEDGWRFALRSRDGASGPAIAFRGCGAELRAIEIEQQDGTRRELALSPGR